jgi:hypothetical protein
LKKESCYSISSKSARTNGISLGFIPLKVGHEGMGYGAIYIQAKNSKKEEESKFTKRRLIERECNENEI